MKWLTSAGEESVVMWRPSDCLDCSDVLGVGVDRLQTAEIPNEELVVVSA